MTENNFECHDLYELMENEEPEEDGVSGYPGTIPIPVHDYLKV